MRLICSLDTFIDMHFFYYLFYKLCSFWRVKLKMQIKKHLVNTALRSHKVITQNNIYKFFVTEELNLGQILSLCLALRPFIHSIFLVFLVHLRLGFFGSVGHFCSWFQKIKLRFIWWLARAVADSVCVVVLVCFVFWFGWIFQSDRKPPESGGRGPRDESVLLLRNCRHLKKVSYIVLGSC